MSKSLDQWRNRHTVGSDRKTEISDSEYNSSDDGKRKREADGCEVFRRSKKTIRSPDKKKMADEDIKKLMAMVGDVMQEIKEMRQEQRDFREEFVEIKQENRELKKKVVELESRLEKIDRGNRRLNLVIKGIDPQEKNLGEKQIQEFLRDKLGVAAKVSEAQRFENAGRDGIIVKIKVDCWEQKEQIMKNKGKLKGSKIYIESDLTEHEQIIQKKIRDIAKSEKERGRQVKVGYQKIRIDGKWMRWNRERGEMVQVTEANTKN